jgi:hypothetical protein
MVSGYGLDDRAIEVRSSAGAEDICIASVSESVLGPTEPPVNWYRVFFPRGKLWLGRDADHSPPSSAEVENE